MCICLCVTETIYRMHGATIKIAIYISSVRILFYVSFFSKMINCNKTETQGIDTRNYAKYMSTSTLGKNRLSPLWFVPA